MFHKEGAIIIMLSLAIAVAVIIGVEHLFTTPWLIKSIQIIALIALFLVLQFFRNPNRELTTIDDHLILAPVDGKVVVIEEVYEPECFNDGRLMVCIAMSR